MTQAILWAAGGTGFTAALTALGASTVFLFGRQKTLTLQRLLLGFAAGVMIAASVWSLLIPAMEQAELYGHALQREVAFLTVHSMLHLLGYDHENGGLEAMRMREKEEAVLLQLGLPRTVSYTMDE